MRRGLILLLMGVLIASCVYAIQTALDFQQEAAIYQVAQDSFVTVDIQEVPLAATPIEVAQPQEETVIQIEEEAVPLAEAPVLDPLVPHISVDFAALTALNPDIIGWLYQADTAISYPIVQGDNNQCYLSIAYDGQYSAAGSIFADYRIVGDFTAENTILYGHNMSTGTMFGSLKSYREADYATLHPYFFVLTDQGYLRYQVCYAFETPADSSVYDFTFTQEGSFAAHLEMLDSLTLYHTDAVVTDQDKLLTLSTCTGVVETQRFVVIAKLDSTEN